MIRLQPQLVPEFSYPKRSKYLNELKDLFEQYMFQGFDRKTSIRMTAQHIDSTCSDGQKLETVCNALNF